MIRRARQRRDKRDPYPEPSDEGFFFGEHHERVSEQP
jgi:hypothetical protein